jgi:hypothetical protein
MSALMDHVKKCRALSDRYFKDHGMCVIYIHQKRPKVECKVSDLDLKVARQLFSVMPNMSERAFLMYSDPKDLEKAGKVFRSVRSIIRAEQSPVRGVVVGFKDLDGIKVGWSLCNKKDKFNKYEGIRLAIEKANIFAASVMTGHALEFLQQQVLAANNFLAYSLGPGESRTEMFQRTFPFPHTCLAAIERVISKIQKRFSKSVKLEGSTVSVKLPKKKRKVGLSGRTAVKEKKAVSRKKSKR